MQRNVTCQIDRDKYLDTIFYEPAHSSEGRAVAKGSVADFPPRWPGFEPRLSDMGSAVDKAALGQVSSEYSGFRYHSFH
jgi:hypothetical protein